MQVEVYSSEKPAVAGRALLAAILLFALVSGLALGMTLLRKEVRLAPRIRPEGWSVSFRPPKGYLMAPPSPTRFGVAVPFVGRSRSGGTVNLAVHRVQNTDSRDAKVICDRVLRSYVGLLMPLGSLARQTRTDVKLGPFDAVEVWEPALGVVVRAAAISGGDAYAVSLGSPDAGDDAEPYETFELMCNSFQQRVP